MALLLATVGLGLILKGDVLYLAFIAEAVALITVGSRKGSRVILVVETAQADPPLEEWLGTLKSFLSDYELPKRIVTLKEIPRNLSMKLDRMATQKIVLTLN